MGVRRFVGRRRDDAELAEELEAHIAHEVDDNVARSMADDEARRQAYFKFSSPSRVREDVWEQNTLGFFENLMRDIGMALTTGGVVMGAAAALGLTRLLGALLFKVSPHDPQVFALALFVMVAAALAACFFPAWRATRIDPVRALRD